MINSSQVKQVSGDFPLISQIFKYGPEQLGHGPCKSAWSPDSNLIAVSGTNKIIRIMDRQGKLVLEFPTNQTPDIESLSWDKDNDSLAILTPSAVISIWSMGQRKFQDVELASAKDIASFISWSRTHPVLVVGTEKGSLLFFNRKQQRKIPCISKHGKKVTSGDWSNEGMLMSCSNDRMLTVSNHQGDTPYDSYIVKGDPSQVKWNPFGTQGQPNFGVMACILSMTKMFLFNPQQQSHRFIEFDKNVMGKPTCYEWLANDKLFIAFNTGRCSVIDVSENNMGNELVGFMPFMQPIEQISVNFNVQKVAVACLGCIKFFNLNTWTEDSADRIDVQKSAG